MAIIPFPATISLPEFKDTSNEVTLRVLKNNFGDGYTQRIKDGLNTRKEMWQLRWTNIRTDEYEAIKTFLDERDGWQAFSWTAPGNPGPLFYICEKYSHVPVWPGYWNLSATFEQVYDLP